MKRITIPEDQEVVGVNKDTGQVVPAKYGLCGRPSLDEEPPVIGFLDQNIWTSDYWRDKSHDKLMAATRMIPAFRKKTPGEHVDVSDRDHEFLVECSMLKGKSLEAHLALQILTLISAITGAKDVKEEKPT